MLTTKSLMPWEIKFMIGHSSIVGQNWGDFVLLSTSSHTNSEAAFTILVRMHHGH